MEQTTVNQYVTCKVCGEQLYSQMTRKHLQTHNFENFKQYRAAYPGVELKSQMLRNKTKMTLEMQMQKYGEEEGRKRFEAYRAKQAVKNTFEFKQQKYGWTREQFDSYNKSRAVTKENLMKRHGDEAGLKKWNDYVEKQKYAGSSEQYFIDMYGKEEGMKKWLDVNNRKRNSLENYTLKYGAEKAAVKYQEYCNKRGKSMFFSRVSQELFAAIAPKNTTKIYYATNSNGEYCVFDPAANGVKFFDYVDTVRKKCIEFNGDCFHANPKFYTESCRPNFFNRDLTAAMIWEEDSRKQNLIIERGFDILVVWENDYTQDPAAVTKQCKEFLYGT